MIELIDIKKTFQGRTGMLSTADVHALRGVSLSIENGGALALLGESGCGKTTLGRILAGLETYDSGDIVIDGTSLNGAPKGERDRLQRKIQLIHQDPYAALNPVRTIEKSLTAPLKLRAKQSGKDKGWVEQRARELLTIVGLDPDEVLYKYPHNLSGGQRQRVVIARALTVDPTVLVADEAVSMIDVSLRLGILQLLNDLRRRLKIAVVFITHDVAAARYVALDGDICVIYRGEIFEYGRTDDVIHAPVNPYTQSLLSAVPVLVGLERPGPDRFIPLEELVTGRAVSGCLFSDRCPFAVEVCHQDHPDLLPIEELSRLNRCFFPTVRHVTAVSASGEASA
ncbi:MAG TPA: ABC transporter ATP-binding protein [Chloroflexota bacterium]|nr:ABC transporter ATP-binding protein [Chloroflexota bacterium]